MRLELAQWLDVAGRAQTASGLSQFMHQLFGPEQVAFRTRIPTMRELSLMGLVKEPEPRRPPKPDARPGPARPKTEVVAGEVRPVAPRSRPVPAIAIAALAALVGG